MIRLNSNLPEVITSYRKQLNDFVGVRMQESVLEALGKVLTEMRSRIHEQGLAADGSVIGKHPDGSNVNLVRSGELRDGLSVLTAENGGGIGWANSEQTNKAIQLENKYGKKIWALTLAENTLVIETATKFFKRAFSSSAG